MFDQLVQNGAKRFLFIVLVSCLLSSCSEFLSQTSFPTNSRNQTSKLPKNIEVIKINRSTVQRFSKIDQLALTTPPISSTDFVYQIGKGDILRIVVWGHPDLMTHGYGDGQQGVLGLTVGSDGSFFFPYAGRVSAEARLPSDIAQELTEKLSNFFPDPQVDVFVSGYHSQKALISGEIGNPGAVAIQGVPITLIEAVSTRGGFLDRADLSQISLEREGQQYFLNLDAFTEQKDASQNPILLGGDIVRVSKKPQKIAYMLGTIAKPQIIDLSRENINLTQALTESGGLLKQGSDTKGIFVFRGVGENVLVAQLDAGLADAFLTGTNFILKPNDVIFVTRAPLSQWNDLISQILPSITPLNGLQPLTR
jgi:polysaccharide export outer membrane protein